MAGVGSKIKVTKGKHANKQGMVTKTAIGLTPKTQGAVWFQPEGEILHQFVHADQFITI